MLTIKLVEYKNGEMREVLTKGFPEEHPTTRIVRDNLGWPEALIHDGSVFILEIGDGLSGTYSRASTLVLAP